MIQTVLFFSLGFLCASFLALLVAPALWRRAARLTRRRVEASVPMSLEEFRADKDRMRAEFAMSTRRLEMRVKSLNRKVADQLSEIDRNRAELERLGQERDAQAVALAELEARSAKLGEELNAREERLAEVSGRLETAERQLRERASELDKLESMYEEASFASSNRQIELVTRETEIDKLNADIAALRSERREADRMAREAAAARKASEEALEGERNRAGALQAKLDAMMTKLSDREDRLERREKDLARLREAMKDGAPSGEVARDVPARAPEPARSLRDELANASLQVSQLPEASADADGVEMEKAGRKHARLEARLTALLRENRKLRGDLAGGRPLSTGQAATDRQDDAVLRERINELAAEVVNLTARLDGPDSPLGSAIAAEVPETNGRDGTATSLAERVRALQKAVATSH